LEYPGFYFTAEEDPEGWWRLVTYHELAHQWFYSAVGNDQYMEPWLDEGFARYAERLAVRKFGPPEQLRDYAQRTLPAGVPLLNSDSDAFYSHGGYVAIYDYGAKTLEELAATLGEPLFTQLMHEWVREYQFKTATVGDFVHLAEKVSRTDLSAFFRDHAIDPGLRAAYRPMLPLGQTRPGP
jgi:aminopeptidase N